MVGAGRDRTKNKARVEVIEGIHPIAAWHIYAIGHKSQPMNRFSPGGEGIHVHDFISRHEFPLSLEPLPAAVVKGFKVWKELK